MGIYNLSHKTWALSAVSLSQHGYGVLFLQYYREFNYLWYFHLLSDLVDTGHWVQKLLDKIFRQSYTDQTNAKILFLLKNAKIHINFLSFYVSSHAQRNSWHLDPDNKQILMNKSDCYSRLKNFRGRHNNTRFPSSWNCFGKHWPLKIFTKWHQILLMLMKISFSLK